MDVCGVGAGDDPAGRALLLLPGGAVCGVVAARKQLLLGARLVSTSVTSLAARGVPVANSSEAFAGLGCCSGKAKHPWLGQIREAASLPSAGQNGHHAGGGFLGGLQSPHAWVGSGWLRSPWSHPPFPAKSSKKGPFELIFSVPQSQGLSPKLILSSFSVLRDWLREVKSCPLKKHTHLFL